MWSLPLFSNSPLTHHPHKTTKPLAPVTLIYHFGNYIAGANLVVGTYTYYAQAINGTRLQACYFAEGPGAAGPSDRFNH